MILDNSIFVLRKNYIGKPPDKSRNADNETTRDSSDGNIIKLLRVLQERRVKLSGV